MSARPFTVPQSHGGERRLTLVVPRRGGPADVYDTTEYPSLEGKPSRLAERRLPDGRVVFHLACQAGNDEGRVKGAFAVTFATIALVVLGLLLGNLLGGAF